VRNDLEAVVQVNQDRRLETAEAGCRAARRQLLSDATESFTMVLPIQSPSGLTGTGKSLMKAHENEPGLPPEMAWQITVR